jgi:CRISPR-associated DxTHG motif protein
MTKTGSCVAISFIGISSHDTQLRYEYDGNVYIASFFAELIRERFAPGLHYLLLTKESHEKHAEKLIRLGFSPDYFIILPSGLSDIDLWDMYHQLFPRIPEQAEVLLDVTHGFRAQPMMAMMVAQYAITIKRIRVKALIYGTYNGNSDEVQPAYDLKPILDVAEWNYVFSVFRETWNAAPLNRLLKQMHQHQIIFEAEPFKKLEKLGKALHLLSNAFQQIRIKTLPKELRFAYAQVNSMISECDSKPYFKPLEDLLRVISGELEYYLLNENSGIFSSDGIAWQIKLVERYIELEQYGQAFTLGNEILISLFMNKIGMRPDLFDVRKVAQKQIVDIINKKLNPELDQIDHETKLYLEEIASKIEAYRQCRNSISHADMNLNELKTSKLPYYSSNLLSELKPYAS